MINLILFKYCINSRGIIYNSINTINISFVLIDTFILNIFKLI